MAKAARLWFGIDFARKPAEAVQQVWLDGRAVWNNKHGLLVPRAELRGITEVFGIRLVDE